MKRRGFVKTLIALPAAPALADQQQAPANPQTPAAQPPAGGRGGGGGGRFGQGNIPKFELTPDGGSSASPRIRFFTPPQFAALHKLSDVLMPPMRGYPGSARLRRAGVSGFPDRLLARRPAGTLPQRSGYAERAREEAVQQIVCRIGRHTGRRRDPPAARPGAVAVRSAEGSGACISWPKPIAISAPPRRTRASGPRPAPLPDAAAAFGGGGRLLHQPDRSHIQRLNPCQRKNTTSSL